jgi:hypothetical protein
LFHDAHPKREQYAALEEKYGLARHAMTIYERATTAVPPNDRLRMYASSFDSPCVEPVFFHRHSSLTVSCCRSSFVGSSMLSR